MPDGPRQFDVRLPDLTLEAGASLSSPVLRGWWWGPQGDEAELLRRVDTWADEAAHADDVVSRDADARRAVRTEPQGPMPEDVPTVVCIHALTGNARVGGDGGWWAPVVGPGEPIDPTRVRILSFNNLGSCYGSHGPGDPDFPRHAQVPGTRVLPGKGGFELPEAELPAPVTTWDQARALLLALDALGIRRVDRLFGGSVGGMIALALAALAPERFPVVAPVAAFDRATPWIIGWNHIGRQVIAEALRHGVPARRALALARQIAHMTYRAGPGLMARHGRRVVGGDGWSPQAPYAVQTYLEHQGSKLASRFDPRAYVAMLDAMDHHDLGRPPPAPGAEETWTPENPWPGLRRITGRIDALAIDSDELFFANEVHDLVVRHRAHGRSASWTLLRSPHGHDAFLMTWDPLQAYLRTVMRGVTPGGTP